MKARRRSHVLAFCIAAATVAVAGMALAQTPAPPAQPASAPPAPVPPATAELREAASKAPAAADLAKGDPGGTVIGNVADVTVTDCCEP